MERDGKGRSTGTLVWSMKEGARHAAQNKHTAYDIPTMHGTAVIRVTVVRHTACDGTGRERLLCHPINCNKAIATLHNTHMTQEESYSIHGHTL